MWQYRCIGWQLEIREPGWGGRRIKAAYCRPCVRAILGGEPRLVEKMQGTEILPVTVARICGYPDGCDEVAAPALTTCWRHRRHGKVFGLPAAQPVTGGFVGGQPQCGCGRPLSHHGRCAFRRGNPGKGKSLTVQVSTEARDALRPNSGTGIPDLSRRNVADAEPADLPVFTVKMTEPMLDTFWSLLDGKSKAVLLSKMGAD